MEKAITCNWYHYIDFDGKHAIELEFVNNFTGAVAWKRYTAATRKAVNAKAQREETRVFNRAARIYKGV